MSDFSQRYIIPESVKEVPKIFGAMSRIMKAVAPIAKDRRNTFHKYDFRGIDDVWNMIHDVFAAEGVWLDMHHLDRTEVTKATKNEGTQASVIIRVLYMFTAEDGTKALLGPVYGEGMDTGDKGTNKATSMAAKIALLNAFAIPTKEGTRDDNDNDSPELADKAPEGSPNAAPIGEETAAKIYTAFGAFGITREQLHRKLQCANVADVSSSRLEQLKAWRADCEADKRNIGKIFGGNSPSARAQQ